MHAYNLLTVLIGAHVVLALPGHGGPGGHGGGAPSCKPNPTITTTSTTYSTATVTVTSGTTSTAYTFLPGQPPATTGATQKVKARDSSSQPHGPPGGGPPGSGTSCLPSSTIARTCPLASTVTVTKTTAQVRTTTVTTTPAATTVTVYPCATPLVDDKGPTYGDAQNTQNLGLSNNIYYGDTPQGASPESCCNTCFFELENCVQAYYYSYEGCVVSQATNTTTGSGKSVSSVCPVGTFDNLTYVPDTNPAFRSTGNIAGPCGQKYTNF